MPNHPSKLIVDLDGCIAGPKPENGDYADCAPNGPLIARLRALKGEGWIIAIHTSRNVQSYDHNVGLIVANTMTKVVRWLEKHNVPFDELWPGKPWPGKKGFYVDDRAVSPNDLLCLTSEELHTKTNGAAFVPGKSGGRAGSEQSWAIIDQRHLKHVSRACVDEITSQRAEHQKRSLVLLSESAILGAGTGEELARLGAKWSRYGAAQPSTAAFLAGVQDVIATGEASTRSLFAFVGLVSSEVKPRARHFNEVTIKEPWVYKTATEVPARRKLAYEWAWLTKVGPSLALTPERVEHGYRLEYQPEGSLNEYVQRRRLSPVEHAWISSELVRLWEELGNLSIQDPYRYVMPSQSQAEHDFLIRAKSHARVGALSTLIPGVTGASANAEWVVNGRRFPRLQSMVETLIGLVPHRLGTRGGWHGDFCPSNVVLLGPIEGDDEWPGLRLIDPRGTVDDKNIAFYGDRRYDLAKLAHALRWGYDALTSGWYDCAFANVGPRENTLDVTLRVWDEDDAVTPSRTRIWDQVRDSMKLGGHTVRELEPEIFALTALQLITCAPLHRDDPTRMIALIARGLQVADHACSLLGTNL